MAKRTHLPIETRLAAVEVAEKQQKTKSEIAKSYGVPCSTLSTWLKNKDILKSAMDDFKTRGSRFSIVFVIQKC